MKQLLYEELFFVNHAIQALWSTCEDGKYTFPNGDWLDQEQFDILCSIIDHELSQRDLNESSPVSEPKSNNSM